ncbi:alpha/beta fold hydrolase [Streptomyces sp. BE303]|uniref:alpha/beta fold hydrolase n=1 Tax=Streptomyces sp. BE303 TaxID=3002528 RepID=UPI002E7A79AB|nr:alpha/beta fold hydrolase [Streptomyces sp. BE303]MED7949240.1 alpha/beta fold hydrolase [Streptomyces sp. BE303]
MSDRRTAEARFGEARSAAGRSTGSRAARPRRAGGRRPAGTGASTAVRRATAAGLAFAACVAVVSAATGPAQAASADASASGASASATSAPRGLDRYYNQRLDWRSCVKGPDDKDGAALEQAGARCADVTVPLDYGDPRGRTITVAISRIKGTDTRHRIGAMLLNDGGPGGETLGTPPRVQAALKETAARYDIIGMDPRFVGRSTPLDCGWPVGTTIASAGLGRASFDRQVAFQKDLAAKCRAATGSLLPHASTRNTARDMDVVRGALGERRISYLGVSYGTYLGTVYTQMFPGRYDRVVLDGALDPRTYGPRLFPGLLAENEQALADWAAWAAARHDTYGLGRTGEEVIAGIRRTVEASARAPLAVGSGTGTFLVDDTRVPFLLFAGIADDTDEARADLAEEMAVLAEAAAGRPARPSEAFAAVLRFAFGAEGSATGSSQQAIMCADGTAPRDPESYWRGVERTRAEHPLLGPMLNNINPCAFWDRPREARTEVRSDAEVLIVAATGDPRTTYRDSVALHGLLPGSRLLTLKGANRHALYGMYGNACVDDTVNAYLASGRLPKGDRTCTK